MNPWAVLASIAALAVFFVLLPVVWSTFAWFRAARRFRCPETGAEAEVSVDARHAALTAAYRPPVVRVKSCSLWPEREGCAQGCVSPAEEAAEPAHSRAS